MLDPLAFLGAAAAAGQFVEQGLAITKFLYSTISAMRDTPSIIQKRAQQIDQLNSVSKLIISHPAYQTDSIASILGACLEDIRGLTVIISKLEIDKTKGKLKRWNRQFLAVMKEDDIVKAFGGLEQDKTTLIVALQIIDAEQLHNIGIQVKTIGDTSVTINDSVHHLETIRTILPEMQQQVTTIHERLPLVSDRLAVLETLVPQILAAQETNRIPKPSGYYNVPNHRVRHFVGREDVIDRIHGALAGAPEDPMIRCVVLRSLGGQGKSQTALEYCRRFRGDPYQSIFWVDASLESSIQRAFTVFYERSEMSSGDRLPSIDAIVEHVRGVFEMKNEPWLIVFDNLDNLDTLSKIHQYIPSWCSSLSGAVLITTRRAQVKELATYAIELGPLGTEEAVRLLLPDNTEPGDEDLETANQIVAQLSCHPLAVAQAGAYIRQKRLPLENFMEHYHRRTKEILSQIIPMTEYQRNLDASESATALSVFTTWDLSFAQLIVGADTKNKIDLLNLLAFAHGVEVSENLFETFCENIEPWDTPKVMSESPGSYLAEHLKKWDSEKYYDILGEFHELALIQSFELDVEGYYTSTFHPLVKDWIRLRIDPITRIQYRLLASEILLEFLDPSVNANKTTKSSRSMTQLMAKLNMHPSLEEDETDDTSDEYKNAVSGFQWTNQPPSDLIIQAEKLFRKGIGEEYAGWDHERWEQKELDIAKTAFDQKRYEEAEVMFRSLLAKAIISEGTWSNRHLDVINDLGECLYQLGTPSRLAEAQAIFESCLARYVDSQGGDSVLLSFMNNLARVLIFCGKYEEGEKMLRGHLKLTTDINGRLHADTLSSMHMLGLNLEMQNRYEEAATYYSQALEGRRAVLGESHPDTLYSMCKHAICMLDNVDMAVKIARQATQGLLEIEGEDGEYTDEALGILGDCLRRQGNYDEAEIQLRHALGSNIRVRGSDSIEATESRCLLATGLREKGALDEAETLTNAAMAGYIQYYGIKHPEVLRTANMLRQIQSAKAERAE